MTMWEQSISSSLLTPAGRRIYFAEHSAEGLLRGDSSNRADFYSKGIADGWLLIDEVRKYENLPRLTDAERNQTAQTKRAKTESGQKEGANPEQDAGA
jgi:phage portal protein BeeE